MSILSQTESFIKIRHDHPNCPRLTLLERTKDSQGCITAVIVTDGRDETALVETALVEAALVETLNKPTPRSGCQDVYQNREPLQWSCDHVSTPESDSFFSLLDFVTRQLSSTVTSFSLNASQLSEEFSRYRSKLPLSAGLGSPPYLLYSYRPSTKKNVRRLLNSVHWKFLTPWSCPVPTSTNESSSWPSPTLHPRRRLCGSSSTAAFRNRWSSNYTTETVTLEQVLSPSSRPLEPAPGSAFRECGNAGQERLGPACRSGWLFAIGEECMSTHVGHGCVGSVSFFGIGSFYRR